MNRHTPSPLPRNATRRTFLTSLSALGAGSLFASRAYAHSARYAQRFQLLAEGTVTDPTLVWPRPDLPPLPEGILLRVRVEFPIHGADILEWHTYLAAADAPEDPLQIITLFHQRVDAIGLSDSPEPNFGLFGQVLDNPIPSPFGDLTGRVAIVYGAFDAPGDNTEFRLFGGAAAGNHASAVSTATGLLRIQGPWTSFMRDGV